MTSNEYFGSAHKPPRAPTSLNSPLPPLPASVHEGPDNFGPTPPGKSPISPFDDNTYPLYNGYNTRNYYNEQTDGSNHDPFNDHNAVPLQTHYGKYDGGEYPQRTGPREHWEEVDRSRDNSFERRRRRRKEKFFRMDSPWIVYILTFVQVTIFLASIIKNAVLTGSPIQIHPQFNPMIGPSFYLLINMGARYVPCMRNQDKIQNSDVQIFWPCPNQTDNNPTCTLSQLCGFDGVPNPHVNGSLNDPNAPNQWFRFIVPIFLHAGLIHIGFNMILQWLIGRDMERQIGHVRFTLVYFAAGIFGFIMGGNFAPPGIASTGASGSLYGIIALVLLDLLYTWPERRRPWRDLLFIFIDIALSFALGLLPGVDNFSHIGGFLMGLALGICLLRSPVWMFRRGVDRENVDRGIGFAAPTSAIHQHSPSDLEHPRPSPRTRHRDMSPPRTRETFFKNRKPLWWAGLLARVIALVGAMLCFILLVQNFYTYHKECEWCKYLSCIDYKNWCDVGDLNFQKTTTPANRLLM